MTLVGLMYGADFTLPAPEEIKADDVKASAIPYHWTIFTFWYKTPEDEGRQYEQVSQLKSPSGKILLELPQRFQMGKPYHRVTARIAGFPVSEAGEYFLRLILREVGDGREGREMAFCPITVSHTSRNAVPQVEF